MPKKLDLETLDAACRIYDQERVPADEAAKRAGISTKTLLVELKARGLTRESGGANCNAFPADRAHEIVDAARAGMSMHHIRQRFHISEGKARRFLRQAGVELVDGRKKGGALSRVVKVARGTLRAGIKAVPHHERVAPTDPDAKLLMRRFAPVCRAQVVDPKAPADLWIVGFKRIPEQEMREMARRVAA